VTGLVRFDIKKIRKRLWTHKQTDLLNYNIRAFQTNFHTNKLILRFSIIITWNIWCSSYEHCIPYYILKVNKNDNYGGTIWGVFKAASLQALANYFRNHNTLHRWTSAPSRPTSNFCTTSKFRHLLQKPLNCIRTSNRRSLGVTQRFRTGSAAPVVGKLVHRRTSRCRLKTIKAKWNWNNNIQLLSIFILQTNYEQVLKISSPIE
jgi:hypothetical protein